MKKVISNFVFCCVLCCVLAFPSMSAAAFQTNSNLMLPPGGEYTGSGWIYSFGQTNISISDVTLSGWSSSVAPPAQGVTISHSCSATLGGTLIITNNNINESFARNANITFSMTGGSGTTMNTELTQMNANISSSLGTILLRESPTLHSYGQTDITGPSGGYYFIDSFFDVFTELSLDGGISWLPSTSSSDLTLVPEPATMLLLAAGAIALRRCRR